MSESTLSGGEPNAAGPSLAFAAPPGNPRFPLFDGLRGVAVLAVLLLHSSEFSGRVGLGVGGRLGEAAGGLGVIVFFVISGCFTARSGGQSHRRRGSSGMRHGQRIAVNLRRQSWIVRTDRDCAQWEAQPEHLAVSSIRGLPGWFL
jgi:Acyltransferase family